MTTTVQRTVTIKDWSYINKAKVRHALFCVAYRVLQGDTFKTACRTTAKRLKRDHGRLRLLARHFVKTEIKTTGDNTK